MRPDVGFPFLFSEGWNTEEIPTILRTFGRRVPLLRGERSGKRERSTTGGVDGCSRKENYKSFDETSHLEKEGWVLVLEEGGS